MLGGDRGARAHRCRARSRRTRTRATCIAHRRAAAGRVAAAHGGGARSSSTRRRSRNPAFDDNITVSGLDVLTNAQRSNAGVSFVHAQGLVGAARTRSCRPTPSRGALFGAGMRHQGRLHLLAVAARRRRHVEHRRLRRLRAGAHRQRLRGARAGDAEARSPRPRSGRSSTGVGTSYSAQVPRVQRERRPREGEAARREHR